ncbi:MAG: hypothetical protein WC511_02660 [Candidatus Pacearchaeota archaeon]
MIKKYSQLNISQVAAQRGYNIGPVYHGTNAASFNIFKGMWNYRFEAESGTSYFSDNLQVAKGYGKRIIEVFLCFKNPLIVDAKGEHWTIIQPPALVEAKKEGKDGVILKNILDTPAGVSEQLCTNYITFTNQFPSQIKLADVVTFNRGVEIPLSERFNLNNPDIRY